MPFTLSHPAAVLPFLRGGRARGPLVASALVAGSLAPDVPFFTESLVHGTFRYGTFTHSLAGIPTADVGIAAALVAGWHWLLREPLVALLPARWGDTADAVTAPSGRMPGPADAAWFTVSAVLGAVTHVGWDAFTHDGRIGVHLLPVLAHTVAGRPVYAWLQIICSAAGLAVLGWYVPHMLRRDTVSPASAAPSPSRPRMSGRAKAAVAALVAAAAAAGAGRRLSGWTPGPGGPFSHLLDALPAALFGAGTGAAVGLTAYAAVSRGATVLRRRTR